MRTASYCVPAAGSTAPGMQSVARGSGLLGWLQISFCHVPLLPSQPYGSPQSLITTCSVHTRGRSFFALLLTSSSGISCAPCKKHLQRSFSALMGKHTPDFGETPAMCPRHAPLGMCVVSSTPGHTPVNQEELDLFFTSKKLGKLLKIILLANAH